MLPALNRILSVHGEAPLSVLPMVVARSDDPFVVVWPVGFPHGSAKNKVRRISTTICLSSKPVEDRRFLKRARCMAQLHSTDVSERQEADAWIQNDEEPYEEGRTHKKPQLASRWIKPGGFYESLAPTQEDVATMESACD